MPIVHPNCANENCYGAYVATRDLGLYRTESLVFDDVSHPTWEHKGQVMGIKQFTFDYQVPENCQVCLDNNNQVWMRRPQTWGDNWVMILDEAEIKAALGTSLPCVINYVEYLPNYYVFATVTAGTTVDGMAGGQYFLKSIDNGTNWYSTDRIYASSYYNIGGGGIGIQYGHNLQYGAGQIIFAAVHTAFGDTAGFVYSRDVGETFYPRDPRTNRVKPKYDGFTSGSQIPVASWKYIASFYWAQPWPAAQGGGHRVHRVDDWVTGANVNKTGVDPTVKNGWLKGWAWAVCHPDQARMYTARLDEIYYTNTLEAALPYPIWNNYVAEGRVSAIQEYAQQVLFGFSEAPLINGLNQTVRSTNDSFSNVWSKSGLNCNTEYFATNWLQVGAIHKDCGGVSIKGIALWDALDPIIPEEPPINSGWPVWINSKATELRADPSWDRLYVVAQTVWPAGEGLFNQPLLFQFLLSGDLASIYYENQGFLAFTPTIAQGQDTIYSGGITYDGHLEMHVDAATYHEATVVGKFTTDEQMYHNEDMTSVVPNYQSGWPIEGWQLVGQFGEQRVTSVAHASTLEDDQTITHNNLAQVTSISGVPWIHDDIIAVPWLVNCQLREGTAVFIGAEPTGQTQPIRFLNITLSGEGWENRGGGLPEVPINDIERGDY